MHGASFEANQTNPTPECMINGNMCYGGWVWVIYLFILCVQERQKQQVLTLRCIHKSFE